MEFKRNEQREAVGRIQWKGLGPTWARSDSAVTLASYFKPNEEARLNPSIVVSDDDADLPFGNLACWGDGVYRKISEEIDYAHHNEVTWSGPDDPNWMQLSYEQQCETTDVLPYLIERMSMGYDGAIATRVDALLRDPDPAAEEVLTDLLKQHGLWDEIVSQLKAAAKIIAYRSWCSAYYEHHVQSIEGDYELFGAFEAQWLEAQGEMPRHWTRMALNTLVFNHGERKEDNDSVYHYSMAEITDHIARSKGRTPECPYPSDAEWELVDKFVDALDDDHFEPTLADFFQ